MKTLTKKHFKKLSSLFSTVALLSLSSLSTAENKAPDKVSGELIKNSGFEATEMGVPVAWNLGHFVTSLSPVSKNGARSLKLIVQDPGTTPYASQSILNHKPNQLLRLTYNVRTDRPGVQYRIYTEFWHPTRGSIEAYNGEWLRGSGAWQDVSAVFKTPSESNRIGVVVQVLGPGTAWFDNVSVKEVLTAAGETPPVPGPPVATPSLQAAEGVEPGVRITADRRFVKDGSPFFPIKIWGWWPQSEEMLKQAHDFGYNVVPAPQFNQTGPNAARLWMDAAQRQGMYAIASTGFGMSPGEATEATWTSLTGGYERMISVLRDHPALFGYNIADEPVLGNHHLPTIERGAQWLKTQDPNHPIFVNHAPANTVEELKAYNTYIDIVGSDIYPVRYDGIGFHSTLPNKSLSIVGDETRKNLEAVDYKKPVMQTLQGFSWTWDKPGDKLFPTRHQSRFMAWDSIVAGATGISWFQDERYPYPHPDLKPVVREFAALQDVLAGKIVSTKGVFAGPIQSIAYEYKGKTVLIAINPTRLPVQLTANWKPAFSKSQAPTRVLWENRKIAAAEMFAPFDVHIYTDAVKDKDILRTEFTVDPITR